MPDRLIRLLLVLLALNASGCGWLAKLGGTRDPFSAKAPCALPPEASKDEVIAYLNKNVMGDGSHAGLTSWRSKSVKVTARGMMGLKADAEIAISAPRNLRLHVYQPVTKNLLMDLGSNDEHFWLWSTEDTHQVMTCRHDDFSTALTELNMPLPFHPDWMMEVFGIVPLNPAEFRMERPFAGSPFADLIADVSGPTGEPMQRVVRINSCHGIVMEHQLRRNDGSTIARAILTNHYRDPETQLIVAKQVRIDWPDIDAYIALDFHDISVNPQLSDDSPMWTRPAPPGSQVVDLGEMARRRRPDAAQLAEEAAGRSGAPDQPPAARQASATPADIEAPAPASPGARDASPAAPNVQLSIETEDWWQKPDERPGRIGPDDLDFEEPEPAGASSPPAWESPTVRMQSPSAPQQPPQRFSLLNWLRSARQPATAPRGAYSAEASRSSSVQPRLGLE